MNACVYVLVELDPCLLAPRDTQSSELVCFYVFFTTIGQLVMIDLPTLAQID